MIGDLLIARNIQCSVLNHNFKSSCFLEIWHLQFSLLSWWMPRYLTFSFSCMTIVFYGNWFVRSRSKGKLGPYFHSCIEHDFPSPCPDDCCRKGLLESFYHYRIFFIWSQQCCVIHKCHFNRIFRFRDISSLGPVHSPMVLRLWLAWPPLLLHCSKCNSSSQWDKMRGYQCAASRSLHWVNGAIEDSSLLPFLLEI